MGLDWYDYGARNYDPAIGRWMNMDVLSEKYPNISNYAYVPNMPTIVFDPDGNEIIQLPEIVPLFSCIHHLSPNLHYKLIMNRLGFYILI